MTLHHATVRCGLGGYHPFISSSSLAHPLSTHSSPLVAFLLHLQMTYHSPLTLLPSQSIYDCIQTTVNQCPCLFSLDSTKRLSPISFFIFIYFFRFFSLCYHRLIKRKHFLLTSSSPYLYLVITIPPLPVPDPSR